MLEAALSIYMLNSPLQPTPGLVRTRKMILNGLVEWLPTHLQVIERRA